jgi:hypothetical protein
MSRLNIPGIAKVLSKWRDLPGCANPACTAKPLMQAISKRTAGMRLFEQWFCSPDCFENGAQQKIVELLSARDRQEKLPTLRMPLGLLLLSRGILSHEQLKIALDRQRASGTNFGDVVQDLGFATQQQVTAAVAAQWGCPVFSLGERLLPAEVHIPKCLLELYGMLPVHYSQIGRRLMVGFVTRVQHHILYTIERMTSCSAAPCFITATEYRQHMQSVVVAATENELVFERSSRLSDSLVEMAKLVRNYVSQAGAEEARFGMCGRYLWVRILGHQEMDLLFRMQND